MKEWQKVLARLQEGYTAEDLCAAIDGCHKTPWNMGENPSGKKYDSLELIVRDSSKVQQFIEADESPPRAVTEKNRRTLRALQEFVQERKSHAP